MVAVLGITFLLLIGPALDRRSAAKAPREFVRSTVAALALLAGASVAFWGALAMEAGQRPSPAALLLLGGVTGAARDWAARRTGRQAARGCAGRTTGTRRAHLRFVLVQLLAGVAVAAVLVLFERLLQRAVDPATVDLRHFSLHPWVADRLALLIGLLSCHVAALWTCTLILSAALARWRLPASAIGLRVQIALLLDRAFHRDRGARRGGGNGRCRGSGWSCPPSRAPSPRWPRGASSSGTATPPWRRASWRCSRRF